MIPRDKFYFNWYIKHLCSISRIEGMTKNKKELFFEFSFFYFINSSFFYECENWEIPVFVFFTTSAELVKLQRQTIPRYNPLKALF